MDYLKIETGLEYNLSELFSKNNVIIIPDLQRDYCWGNSELVKDFINNVVNNGYNNKRTELNLGLIYGYETPKGHINLCDGQQRLTTLFLLLGMINRKADNYFFYNLISDFEYNEDDREPYLQYSIRESSLYFLSDLVCNFFNSNTIEVSKITKQDWYFDDYTSDSSIQSMLLALKTIDKEISNINDYKDFGNFLLNKLKFMYYNLGSRQNGEETFVIINTTGEPLTTSENIKPVYINSQNENERKIAAEKWENWENWFWQKRKGEGLIENDTSENGFSEFLRWINLLTTDITTEDVKFMQDTGILNFNKKAKIEEIERYFNIVTEIFRRTEFYGFSLNLLSPKADLKMNTMADWLRLIPVIEYLKIYENSSEREKLRVVKFFNNIARVTKNAGEILPKAIKLIRQLNSNDIASCIYLTGVSEQLLTKEETLKFKIYLDYPEIREIIENQFWDEEDSKIWLGEILPLIHWSTEETFDFEIFKAMKNLFNSLFPDQIIENKNLDLIRRALLTRKLYEYPKKYRGNTNTSFAYKASDWKSLFYDNISQFKAFFNELMNSGNPESKMLEMIEEFDVNQHWAEFIKDPYILSYSKQKNIQWSSRGWQILSGSTARSEYFNLATYRLYKHWEIHKFWNTTEWKLGIYNDEGSCVTFQCLFIPELKITVYYNGKHSIADSNGTIEEIEKFTINVYFKDSNLINQNFMGVLINNIFKYEEGHYKSDLVNLDVGIIILKNLMTSLKFEDAIS